MWAWARSKPKIVFELMSIQVKISGSSVYNVRCVRILLVASSGVGVRCGGAQSDSTFFCLLPSEALWRAEQMATTSYSSGNVPPSSVQPSLAPHTIVAAEPMELQMQMSPEEKRGDMYLCPENIWLFLPVQSSRLMHFNSFDLQIYILLFSISIHAF